MYVYVYDKSNLEQSKLKKLNYNYSLIFFYLTIYLLKLDIYT